VCTFSTKNAPFFSYHVRKANGAFYVVTSTMTMRVNTELLASATFWIATQPLMLFLIFRRNGMLNGALKANHGAGNRFPIVNGDGCRSHCGEKAGPENGAAVGEGAADP
jgi:hypothetical protein